MVRDDDELLERQVMLGTVYLAIYRILKKREKDVKEIWQLCSGIVEKMLKSIPWFKKWLLRMRLFSSTEKIRIKQSAELSKESNYPEDFVFDYVEGNGKKYDYGMNIVRCALCKFLARKNAHELLPFICKTDFLFSKHFGYELSRTKTIAGGDDMCDFRFKK